MRRSGNSSLSPPLHTNLAVDCEAFRKVVADEVRRRLEDKLSPTLSSQINAAS